MLEMLTLAGHLAQPVSLEWSERKRALRERLAHVVVTSNAIHQRNDRLPRMTMERLHGGHGKYDHVHAMLSLDIESVNDARKFWHVHDETIAHEWAHHLNAGMNGSRGHDEDFEILFRSLQDALNAQAVPH